MAALPLFLFGSILPGVTQKDLLALISRAIRPNTNWINEAHADALADTILRDERGRPQDLQVEAALRRGSRPIGCAPKARRRYGEADVARLAAPGGR
jgi:hypothetical protein